MNDLTIGQLTVMGIGADIRSLFDSAVKDRLFLARGRTASHWLKEMGIGRVEEVNLPVDEHGGLSDWVDHLLARIRQEGVRQLCYVTSIQPIFLDVIAGEFARVSNSVDWRPGKELWDIFPPLTPMPLDGTIQIIDILKLQWEYYPAFSPSLPVILLTEGIKLDIEKLLTTLTRVYPLETAIQIKKTSNTAESGWCSVEFDDLQNDYRDLSAIFIPALARDASLESFMQVIAKLRAPDGCPWDRKQTHTSLRPYLLEETYEALEQLDRNDLNGLREELGDLLLQIALHSQIASENGSFNMSQVLQKINRKIVSRHPHVFSSVRVRDEKDVVENWEKLKELERAGNGKTKSNGLLDGIPQILPALSQAQSIQERAARVGFDWPEIAPVLAKVVEEMREVNEAANEKERAEELGDLLFAVVNLVRWYKVDAESALRYTNQKFRKRFAFIEIEAKKMGRELHQMTLEEMDALWERAKAFDEP